MIACVRRLLLTSTASSGTTTSTSSRALFATRRTRSTQPPAEQQRQQQKELEQQGQQQGQQQRKQDPDGQEIPPDAPGMMSAIASMVFGAGGAVLVAAIGCVAVFQMALSVSEHAGSIHKHGKPPRTEAVVTQEAEAQRDG